MNKREAKYIALQEAANGITDRIDLMHKNPAAFEMTESEASRVINEMGAMKVGLRKRQERMLRGRRATSR